MKEWIVEYCDGHIGKTRSSGWNTENEALAFLTDVKIKGGQLRGLKCSGKYTTQRHVLEFERRAESRRQKAV
jgi:hypothetical protein